MERAAGVMSGARTSSYYSTGNLMYVSKDRHTTFEEIYPPGKATFDTKSQRRRCGRTRPAGLPPGIEVEVTGHDPLEEASTHGDSGGPSVLLDAVVGGLGALVILLFVFGTLPAVLMPIAVAVAAILNTFTLVWALTYVTNVSIIVEFTTAHVRKAGRGRRLTMGSAGSASEEGSHDRSCLSCPRPPGKGGRVRALRDRDRGADGEGRGGLHERDRGEEPLE
jgi:hypothetical protein